MMNRNSEAEHSPNDKAESSHTSEQKYVIKVVDYNEESSENDEWNFGQDGE